MAAIPGAPTRQRIAKLMARAGLCSRRDAETWIIDGRVSVNGTVLTSPALDVGPDDRILVDDMPLPTVEKTRLFLFHKPRGLVTSDHDPEGRQTVADYLHEHWPDGPRVVTIGRLDINTEGLLLLTNDGGLARMLELPATGWVRRYRVRAKGETDPATLESLSAGVTIDGIDYAGVEAKLDRIQGANCWLTMGLREGKNREVKRLLEHIGLEVNRLIRLSFGPFQLLDLPEGAVEEVKTRVLRDQLGEKLAAQAGVDFGDADIPPMPAHEPRGRKAPADADARRGPVPDRRERSGSASRTERPGRAIPSDKPSARASGRRDDRPSRSGPGRPEDREEAPPPLRERPIAGTRKHVSTLRSAEVESARKGPRQRIERTATQDRRDRTVKVERLVSSRPPERPQHRVREADTPERGTRPPRLGKPRDETAAHRPPRAPRPPHAENFGRHEGRGQPDDRAKGRRSAPTAAGARLSPSALAKRERVSRSGGDRPARADRASPRERAPRPIPTREERPRETGTRERRDEAPRTPRTGPPGPRRSEARGPKPSVGATMSREVRKPRGADRKPGERPTGAASRKPNKRPGGDRPPARGKGGPPRGGKPQGRKPTGGAGKPKR
jgi:23S rRNA pseudouridine2605 synthase